jgi:hypothetical protein
LSGNTSASYNDSIILDTQAPTGSVSINSGTSYATSTSTSLTLSATDIGVGISQMMVCNASDFSGCTWETYSTSKSWTLTTGDGNKAVYIKFNDLAGNVSSTYNDTIILDTQVPTGSITINSGAASTSTGNTTLTISGIDGGSGVSQMEVCNASDFSGCSWETYSTTKSWTLISGDGTKTVYIKFKDNAGNQSSVYNDVILLDTQAPSGSILINLGDAQTQSLNVSITMNITDAGSGVSQMMICADSSFSGCSWETYSSTKAWTLSYGNGTKTIYAKFVDLAGNQSTTYSDNIVLNSSVVDSQPPTGSVSINNGASSTTSTNVNLTINATDDLSGVSQMIVCNNTSFSGCSWETYNTSKAWILTSGNGTKTVYIKFKDVAGNESTSYSDNITLNIQSTTTPVLDTQAPTGSISINNGSVSTTSTNVNLNISAVDNKSGVSQMIVCNVSDFSGCTWETYSTTKTWVLTSGNGTKTVYIKFKDSVGNESTAYSSSIIFSSSSDTDQTSWNPTLSDGQYIVDVSTINNIVYYSEVKIKITDENGNPISGLVVTLDSSKEGTTGSGGIVTFSNVSEGEHALGYTYKSNKQTNTIEVKGSMDPTGKKAVLDTIAVQAKGSSIFNKWTFIAGGIFLAALAAFIIVDVVKGRKRNIG